MTAFKPTTLPFAFFLSIWSLFLLLLMNFLLEFYFISTVHSLVILWSNVVVAALGFTTCTVTYRDVPLVTQPQCDGSAMAAPYMASLHPTSCSESSGILLPSSHALNYTLFLLSTIIF